MADLRFGAFEIDTAAELLRRDGEIVHLEPRIFHLLLYLLEHRDRLVTKQDLNEQVWAGAFVTDNAVDRAVARLRKALGDDVHQPRFIETVPTRGYRFIAKVDRAEREVAGAAAAIAMAPVTEDRGARFRLPVSAVVAVCALSLLGVLAVALRSRVTALAPVASPGGERVVARQLTTSDAFEFGPTFSPDGASLAYTANRSGRISLWVRSLAPGGRERELAETSGARIAAWSPDGRYIAYDSYNGIWIVPPTGGSPRQLVERGGTPRWSPDGTTLVFQNSVEGVDINSWAARPPSTLWTVGLDGSPPHQITRREEPPGGHGQPSFSPDGRHIAFVTAAFGLQGEMWTVSANGGDLRRVLAGCQCRDPIYSRDGATLYYDDYVDSHHGLWAIAAAGGQPPRRLYEAPLRFLSLAPDGRRLAASRHQLESDLWSIPVDPQSGAPTGPPEPFTLEDVERNQFPVCSPDGERLTFIVTRAGNLRELWMVPTAGGRAEMLVAGGVGGWSAWSADSRQVFFVNDNELQRIDVATRRVETVFRTDVEWQYPAVAPGGGLVAFTVTDANGISNVWTLDAAGRRLQITRETEDTAYPTWSPDGRWLAVEIDSRRGTHLGYVSADGGTPVLLTDGADQCFTGGWSPDGDKIVYPCRPIHSPVEHWNIWWVSRSTGEKRRLTERPLHPGREFVRYPTWSADGSRIFFELAQSKADLWLLELPDDT